MDTSIFQIAPAGSRPFVLLIPVAVLLVIAACALVVTMAGSRHSRFEVSEFGLRLRGDLYGRTITWSQLDAASARRVDFGTEPGLSPARRTLGTGMPGYRSGWFRLRNGDRALLYLTDPSRAVYVPTRANYSVLLSPDDPEAFLRSLKARAGSTQLPR